MSTTFKILLVGNSATGKTTYTQRMTVGSFLNGHVATTEPHVMAVTLNTSHDPVQFHIHDQPGSTRLRDSREIFDGAIVMFSVDSRGSFDAVDHWIQDISRTHGAIPIVICGNKVDLKHVSCTQRQISRRWRHWSETGNVHQYYNISARSNYNFGKPYQWLARYLTSIESLRLL